MRFLVAFWLASVTTVGVAHGAAVVDEDAEIRALNQLNQARAEAGLAPLALDERLGSLARYHAADVALAGDAFRPRGLEALEERARPLAKGERLEVRAAAADDLARATTALSDPSLTRVGIGCVVRDGRHYVVEVAVADKPVAVEPASPAYTASLHALFFERVRAALLHVDRRVADRR